MDSEQSWNKTNDGTSFQPSEPTLCANGCGFFGSAATMNLCSKCYRDLRMKEEQAASAKAAVEKSFNQVPSSKATVGMSFDPMLSLKSSLLSCSTESAPSSSSQNRFSFSAAHASPVFAFGNKQLLPNEPTRCWSCDKRVGLVGFHCRCGSTFCATHRYPENHECSYDFKSAGRDAIAKENPVVKADKVQRF